MPAGTTLLLFAAAAAALVLVPGPNVLFLVARGISDGRRTAVLSAFGVETATAVFVLASALGLTAVLASSGLAFAAVKYGGAAYLCYLGVRALRSRGDEALAQPAAGGRSASRAFGQGFGVGITNPKVAVFFLAFFPQFVDPARGAAAGQVLVLGVLFLAIGVTFDMCWALAAGGVGGWLRRHPRLGRRQRYLTGTIYLTLGVSAAASGSRG